jgi:hypothetical protein
MRLFATKWLLVGTVALLAGCTASDSTSKAVPARSSQWNVNAGRFVPAGVVSFASLSGAEICGLVGEKTVSKELAFDFGGFEPGFEIGERGASCGFDATSDGFQGDRLDVRWFVGPPKTPNTSEPTPSEVLTRSQSFVDGVPVSLNVNGEMFEATMRLDDRVVRVTTFTDNEQRQRHMAKRGLALLAVVHSQVMALHPRAQPDFDAQVSDVFALSPAQLCSLLRDRTVASLSTSPVNLFPAPPDTFDVTLLRSDVLWCSKGRGKLELLINAWITRDYPDQAVRGLPSISSIGLRDSEDPTSQQARLEVAASQVVDGGIEERVISLIAQGTEYNATSREILRREMDYIIGELNRRLPQPLVYKL